MRSRSPQKRHFLPLGRSADKARLVSSENVLRGELRRARVSSTTRVHNYISALTHFYLCDVSATTFLFKPVQKEIMCSTFTHNHKNHCKQLQPLITTSRNYANKRFGLQLKKKAE